MAGWSGAGKGAVAGGSAGAMFGPWGAGIGAGAGAVAGGLGLFDEETAEQVPLETPEQRAARQMLMRFAETGQFGAFKAGEAQNLGYGDFNATSEEQTGLTGLRSLLASGIPDQYRLGDQAIRDLMDTSEAGIDRQFQPYNALTERAAAESRAAVKRGAGFAGNLYSTDTIKKLGDVEARTYESKAAELARLTEGALNRKASVIPLAMQSARDQENIQLGRLEASQAFGSLTRRLNDASVKARDTELLRRRQELQLPIQAATAVAGTPSQYQDLLAMVGQVGGQYAAGRAYGAGTKAGRK